MGKDGPEVEAVQFTWAECYYSAGYQKLTNGFEGGLLGRGP